NVEPRSFLFFRRLRRALERCQRSDEFSERRTVGIRQVRSGFDDFDHRGADLVVVGRLSGRENFLDVVFRL
ncbi:MAG TPA: hypothetical protein VG271_09975, partial [Beijerinckiaceae bacterium]|nr:hypothetical protein [Beijerinckiaceae bacterium]